MEFFYQCCACQLHFPDLISHKPYKRPMARGCMPIAIQAVRKLKPTSSLMANPLTTALIGKKPTSFHTHSQHHLDTVVNKENADE